jgi:hypothetical protein
VGWTRPEMKGKRYLHRQATQSKRTLPRLYFSWRNGTAEYVCLPISLTHTQVVLW